MVATPIGNLSDLSDRARSVLADVDLIAAEDTRRTRGLLEHLELKTPLISYHAHSGPQRLDAVLSALDQGDVALVSDAGVPAVSDPGADLVAAARAAGHTVVAVPGASAVTAALSVSGIDGDGHVFVGFLPRRSRDLLALLESLAGVGRPVVAFEAPHRIASSLATIAERWPDLAVFVGRELTKLHEEGWSGTAARAAERWADGGRGEFTLVLEPPPAPAEAPWTADDVRAALEERRRAGQGAKQSSREVAELAGWSGRDVYDLWNHDAESE